MSQHTLQNNREGAHDITLTISWPWYFLSWSHPKGDGAGTCHCGTPKGAGCEPMAPSLPKAASLVLTQPEDGLAPLV